MNEKLSKANCRIEQIVHLDSMFVDGIVADTLEDLLDDYSIFEQCLESFINLGINNDTEESCELDTSDAKEVFSTLRSKGITGFCVQVSTPLPRRSHTGKIVKTWGITANSWFYGDTYEAAVDSAIAWALKIQNTVDED